MPVFGWKFTSPNVISLLLLLLLPLALMLSLPPPVPFFLSSCRRLVAVAAPRGTGIGNGPRRTAILLARAGAKVVVADLSWSCGAHGRMIEARWPATAGWPATSPAKPKAKRPGRGAIDAGAARTSSTTRWHGRRGDVATRSRGISSGCGFNVELFLGLSKHRPLPAMIKDARARDVNLRRFGTAAARLHHLHDSKPR